jgi:MFS transporter, Spinster family, sphingosine-1-phosphate transporter
VTGASRYRQYLLAVLGVILAFNYVDRLALGLLLQDIKVDLGLTDTQLGFMNGFAFAVFYSVMGIPIARWADRGNRVAIITVTTALWSTAVALCGLASNLVQLVLIRIGVAVGEAGCIPPAHSLIADHFSRAERPRAVSRYLLGKSFSVVIGYLLAGWLNDLYGWRTTFVILGFPGVVLAALAWLTLREPRLQGRVVTSTPPKQPGLKEVCSTLWRNRTFCHLLFCYTVASFFSYGILQWKPAFFMRSYGLPTTELGAWFAAVYGVSGLLGLYIGGELASRFAANDERSQLRVMAGTYAGLSLLSVSTYLSPHHYLAFALLALTTLCSNIVVAPLFATIQTLVPDRMRAVSVAIIYLFANFIGMGLGPLAAGVISDAYRVWAGEESLRYALLTLSPGYIWVGLHLWHASRTVVRDLNDAKRHSLVSAVSGS